MSSDIMKLLKEKWGNQPWLLTNTILVVLHGSHAYGLSTPTSDVDLKGVAVAPKDRYLGFSQGFDQAIASDPDMVIFDVRKFFKLTTDCNPNMLEILWGKEEHIQFSRLEGRLLCEHRDLFLSKKARHTFSGYAHQQLKRINTHYRWLKSPPKEPPKRSDFGLPERSPIPPNQLMAAQAAVEKKFAEWNLDDMDGLDPAQRIAVSGMMADLIAEAGITESDRATVAGRLLGFDDNFIHLLDLERRYKSGKTDWDNYRKWLATRNPARAELEKKYGYDTKHAMHLVRLMRMAREILEEGKVLVTRPDREELLAIRNGAWSYEQVVEWARQKDKELEEIYKTSPLPHSPDRKALDSLCIRIVENMLYSSS